ncbi:type II toxin-antitoxin system RelE/ParE family toxin [Schinkia azotoformans]|uniref:type II toxin-antitoxin system RelE/ParE family toxin n=1 Tax=Schinkia azotoformans TaxID=1454 RepID=UPI0009DE49BA
MDEIFSYVSADNIIAAEKLLDNLNHQIGSLASFPNMGSLLSEEKYTLVERGYRFIIVHPYLVFYRIFDDSIIIHRILHGKRDYLRENGIQGRELCPIIACFRRRKKRSNANVT